jgi:hypothetical protein
MPQSDWYNGRTKRKYGDLTTFRIQETPSKSKRKWKEGDS